MSRNNGRQELFFPRIALLLLISSVFLGIQQVFSSNDWFSFRNFKKLPGHSLIGNVTGTHKFPDDLTCAFACVGDTQCFSFNFGGTSIDNLFTCELSNSLGAWDPQNLKNRPGFDLYEVVVSFLLSLFLLYYMVRCCMVWYGMVWYSMVWYGMVWYHMIWYGTVWYGMVWYGMVW